MKTEVKGTEISVIKLSNLKSRSITVLGHQKNPNGKHFLFLSTPTTNTLLVCEVDVEILHHKEELFGASGIYTITFDKELGADDRKVIFVSRIREVVR